MHRFVKSAVCLMAVLPLAIGNAPAQTSPPATENAPVALKAGISLSESLQLADAHNMQLQAAQQDQTLRRFDVKIARRFPNPQYAGIYTAGKLYTQLSFPQQFGINQQIETAGKRGKRTAVAQAQSRLSELQYAALRWDIRSQVRRAYAELLGAEQNVALIDAQADLLDRLVDITRKRVQAGAAPGAELYQARLSRNQLTTRKNEALSQVDQAHLALNGLLNNSLSPDFEISDTGLFQVRVVKTELAPTPAQPLPDLNALCRRALETRADLKAMAQQQVVTQKQLTLTKAQRVPDLFLSAGYQYAITPVPLFGHRFFPGPYLSTTVELPVFHNQGAEIGKLQTTLRQNDLYLQNLQRDVTLQVQAAYVRLKTARDNLDAFQGDLIPEAKKVLYLAERSYQVGKTPLANVILAQQSFQQIIADYTQTVINYQNAWGDLEKAVGAPMSAW